MANLVFLHKEGQTVRKQRKIQIELINILIFLIKGSLPVLQTIRINNVGTSDSHSTNTVIHFGRRERAGNMQNFSHWSFKSIIQKETKICLECICATLSTSKVYNMILYNPYFQPVLAAA